VWEFKTSGPVFCSPSIFLSSQVKDGSILFGSHDGFVYCVSNLGELRWKFATDSQVYSTPFVALLFCDKTKVTDENTSSHLKMDIPDTSRQLTVLSEEHENTCASQTKLCQGIGMVSPRSIPVVFVCSTRGTLYCLSLDRGVFVSSWSFSGQVFSSPVVVGNDILVGCRDDFLYCMEINLSMKAIQVE
jgi:acyl-CoA synthetase